MGYERMFMAHQGFVMSVSESCSGLKGIGRDGYFEGGGSGQEGA